LIFLKEIIFPHVIEDTAIIMTYIVMLEINPTYLFVPYVKITETKTMIFRDVLLEI